MFLTKHGVLPNTIGLLIYHDLYKDWVYLLWKTTAVLSLSTKDRYPALDQESASRPQPTRWLLIQLVVNNAIPCLWKWEHHATWAQHWNDHGCRWSHPMKMLFSSNEESGTYLYDACCFMLIKRMAYSSGLIYISFTSYHASYHHRKLEKERWRRFRTDIWYPYPEMAWRIMIKSLLWNHAEVISDDLSTINIMMFLHGSFKCTLAWEIAGGLRSNKLYWDKPIIHQWISHTGIKLQKVCRRHSNISERELDLSTAFLIRDYPEKQDLKNDGKRLRQAISTTRMWRDQNISPPSYHLHFTRKTAYYTYYINNMLKEQH